MHNNNKNNHQAVADNLAKKLAKQHPARRKKCKELYERVQKGEPLPPWEEVQDLFD